MTSEDELLSLAKEMQNSDAYKYVSRIETLTINFSVFRRNYKELNKLIDISLNPQKMNELWDLRNRHKLEAVIYEIHRLLHNFLAAAESLVSHSRVAFRKWYKGTEFLKAYQAQINNRFVENPMTRFIQDLRNYNLHYAHPNIMATFSIKTDEETGDAIQDFSFVLVKSSLLQWNRWETMAKKFLDSCDDEIDVGSLANEYYKEVLDFNKWILHQLQEIHKEDLAWYEEMRQKTINAMSDEEKRSRGLI